MVCPDCERGQRYCSPECAAARHRETVRAASAAFQRTPHGAALHARRQEQYRKKLAGDGQVCGDEVTQQGVTQATPKRISVPSTPAENRGVGVSEAIRVAEGESRLAKRWGAAEADRPGLVNGSPPQEANRSIAPPIDAAVERPLPEAEAAAPPPSIATRRAHVPAAQELQKGKLRARNGRSIWCSFCGLRMLRTARLEAGRSRAFRVRARGDPARGRGARPPKGPRS